jgi:hypothetical protein
MFQERVVAACEDGSPDIEESASCRDKMQLS